MFIWNQHVFIISAWYYTLVDITYYNEMQNQNSLCEDDKCS